MVLMLKILDTSHWNDRGLKVKVCGEVTIDRVPTNFAANLQHGLDDSISDPAYSSRVNKGQKGTN
jgi:hypothetical protein